MTVKLRSGEDLAALIARLEEAIPAAMVYRDRAAVLRQEPEIAQRPAWAQPPAAIPGLSVALIQDAEVVWAKGFGVKNAKTKEPVTPQTHFAAWSCSKPVAAYAALKMCELGLLDLDQPVNSYLRDPIMPDAELMGRVTLRTLVTHSSGLGYVAPGQLGPRVPCGSFEYSSAGFEVLTRIVEDVSGLPFGEYMRSAMLEPLGLGTARFIWTEADLPQGADLHGGDGQPRGQDLSATGDAAGSLYATPSDYARFMCKIMRPPPADQHHLSPQGVAAMLTAQVNSHPRLSWGLGWGLQHTGEGDCFWHYGGWDHAFALGFAEHRVGMVIMANCDGGWSWDAIVGAGLGGDYTILPWHGKWSWRLSRGGDA